MEKFRLVQEQKADPDDILIGIEQEGVPFPEVRITQQGKPRNYISYAMNLFTDGSNTIVLKAMGRAMNKAVTIAEILKRKMSLHQWNVLSSAEMIDLYEPIEEGLDIVTSRRYVSCMTITLSITLIQPTPHPETTSNVPYVALDVNHPGYQPPLPSAEMHPRDFHPSQQQSQQLIPSS